MYTYLSVTELNNVSIKRNIMLATNNSLVTLHLQYRAAVTV